MSGASTRGRHGLLLFAHGARDPRWAAPFAAVRERTAALRPGSEVRLAFLEFMAPGLVDAGGALVAAGCTAVDVMPLFLGAGGHVRKDVPALVAALVAAHPQVQWRLARTIGVDPRVIEAIAQAAAFDEARVDGVDGVEAADPVEAAPRPSGR